ncbi:MAG: response regulator transcription factor [Ruminococcus sp.]
MRILIVEDYYPLADTVATVLRKEHYIVDVVGDGEQGYEHATTGIYDLAILDLMLPKMNGYQVLEKLRNENNTIPVLILSAKSELDDKVKAFKHGADDYMSKPFEIEELVMRVGAIIKRSSGSEIPDLSCGNLVLDVHTCQVINSDNKKSLKISGKELHLLEMFLYNKNQVLTKSRITDKIWGYDANAEYNNVEVYVSFLRRKIKSLQCNANIRSVRGVGYAMEIEE